VLSTDAQWQWEAFAASLEPGGPDLLRRDLLNRFVVGVHLRGKECTAHDLKLLLDATSLDQEGRDAVVGFVEPALALLATYDGERPRDGDPGLDLDEDDFDEDDLDPGTLVL